MFSFFTRHSRRKELLRVPFPSGWLDILQENVFLYRLLSEAEQARLRDILRIFIAETFWEGCRGQQITDEVKVTVAGQACLLLLGFDSYFFEDVTTVLLYPGGFLAEDPEPEPEEEEGPTMLIGQAVARGPVLLSWWDVRWDGQRLGESNLVLHEFAHKLGQLDDPQTAVPFLSDPARQKRWQKVMRTEMRLLRRDADYDRPTLLDPYGADSPAEFFAVATESFFLQPRLLHRWHPRLYHALSAWYNQDPQQRREPTEQEQQAMQLSEQERDRHRIAECSAALRLHPDYVAAYLGRADAQRRLGQHELALADYDAVLRLQPDDAETLCDRGVTYRELGRLTEAVADFTRAHELLPEYALALCERGITRARQGDLAAALADLNAAIALDPHDDGTYRARAEVYFQQGAPELARADLAEAVRLCPRSASADEDG